LREMQKTMPKVYGQLEKVRVKLEKHYRDMQDMEFTVEDGKLYMLQTRTGKRTPAAAFRIAVDMANEKLITKEEAILRIKPEDIAPLLSGDRCQGRQEVPDVKNPGHWNQRCARRGRRQSCFLSTERKSGPSAARKLSWSGAKPALRMLVAWQSRRAF